MKSQKEIALEDRIKKTGYDFQQFAKDHPDTDESPWGGDEKQLSANLEKEYDDAVSALESFQAGQAARESRKAKLDEVNEFLHAPAGKPNLYPGNRAGEIDDEEFRTHQRKVFALVVRDGFANTNSVVDAYCQEHGIKDVPHILKFSEKEHKPSREIRAMIVGDQMLGGALVPPQQYAERVQNIGAITKLAGMCRTIQATGPYVPFPRLLPATDSPAGNKSIYPSDYAGAIKGEAPVLVISDATPQNQPRTGSGRIDVHRYQPNPTQCSLELMEDAATFEMVLNDIIDKTLGVDKEGFIVDCNGEPMTGVLNGTGDYAVDTVNVGTTWGWTGLTTLLGDFPEQYEDPSVALVVRKATHFAFYRIKDDAGNFVLTANQPVDQILGTRIVHSAKVAAVTGAAKSGILGAWKYFWIADRMELRIGRLDQPAFPDVWIQPVARFGGQVVLGDAFRIAVNSQPGE